ncbi:MAG TPA: hypothetical protein VNQ53_12180 [Nocardioides sp.]|nr:hypothetical protein [Nocardioides sp.]
MTRIEDRLRSALTEEADARTVDVLRMRDELNDRLGGHSRRRRVLPMVAAAVLLTGGAVVGVQTLRDDDAPPVTAPSDAVDDEFSCAETRPVDLSGGQDEFVPDLAGRTAAQVAREYDAPLWEFVEDGNEARLRLGNTDGTLGSETRYRRRGGEWQMVSSVACGNGTPAAPTSDALRLGAHVKEPWPANGLLSVGTQGAAPILVDDRPVFDYSGLTTRHRAIYLAPCGIRLCFAVGQPDGVILPKLATYSGRDAGILGPMCDFFVPDDLVGRESPYALLVAWDAIGRTSDFSVSGPGGTYEGKPFTDPSWGPQRVWLALVPTTGPDVDIVARLHDADGLVDQFHGPVECD